MLVGEFGGRWSQTGTDFVWYAGPYVHRIYKRHHIGINVTVVLGSDSCWFKALRLSFIVLNKEIGSTCFVVCWRRGSSERAGRGTSVLCYCWLLVVLLRRGSSERAGRLHFGAFLLLALSCSVAVCNESGTGLTGGLYLFVCDID